MFNPTKTIAKVAISARHLHLSPAMNFKFKFTEQMAKDFEKKMKEKEEEEEKNKPKPAAITFGSSLIMGRVSSDRYKSVVKIGVPKHRFNERYLMYVREQDDIYALDEDHISRAGDWVLLRRDPTIPDEKVTHKILKIVYGYGHYVDPLTNKRSLGLYYEDDVKAFEKIKLEL